MRRSPIVPATTASEGSDPNEPPLGTPLETRAGRQGRLADYLTRMDFVVLDELGYLPFRNRAASFYST